MKKKILVVGMLDSLHLARWMSQFVGSDLEFILFPSKKFRRLHPDLLKIVKNSGNIKLAVSFVPLKFYGYIDFILLCGSKIQINLNFRSRFLAAKIRANDPQIVHTLEMQGAGYVCLDALKFIEKDFCLIVTNWGSDIFYYQNFPTHLVRIKALLAVADAYSAECDRDYLLASKLGFMGKALPCIPNGGGFSSMEIDYQYSVASTRRGIVVKAYGGTFGRGALTIKVLQNLLKEFPEYSVYLYSVTRDLYSAVSKLSDLFPGRVRFSILDKGISHDALREIFANSRVYIGCSISDGISTSFLESLITGAYPIQTNTSCAGEWLTKGAVGSLIPVNELELTKALKQALESDAMVNQAQTANRSVSKNYLSKNVISNAALTFY